MGGSDSPDGEVIITKQDDDVGARNRGYQVHSLQATSLTPPTLLVQHVIVHNCGAVGRNGPTQSACNTAYNALSQKDKVKCGLHSDRPSAPLILFLRPPLAITLFSTLKARMLPTASRPSPFPRRATGASPPTVLGVVTPTNWPVRRRSLHFFFDFIDDRCCRACATVASDWHKYKGGRGARSFGIFKLTKDTKLQGQLTSNFEAHAITFVHHSLPTSCCRSIGPQHRLFANQQHRRRRWRRYLCLH